MGWESWRMPHRAGVDSGATMVVDRVTRRRHSTRRISEALRFARCALSRRRPAPSSSSSRCSMFFAALARRRRHPQADRRRPLQRGHLRCLAVLANTKSELVACLGVPRGGSRRCDSEHRECPPRQPSVDRGAVQAAGPERTAAGRSDRRALVDRRVCRRDRVHSPRCVPPSSDGPAGRIRVVGGDPRLCRWLVGDDARAASESLLRRRW